MLKLTKKQRGFTIVELLIVIVVIGILAAITIVAYNNVNDKARASSAVSALDQAKKKLELYKAENDGYPTDLVTIGIENSPSVAYEYTNSANTDYCLTATVSNISYYLNNSTKTSPAEGGCSDHTWPGGVAMTNLVTNGDFSQGVSGWNSTASSLTATGGVLTATVTSVGGNAAISRGGMNISLGRVYHISFNMNPFSNHVPAVFIGNYNSLAPSIPANTTTRVSGVVTAGSNGTTLTMRLNRDNTIGMTVGSMARFSNIALIDLTAAFGAGNEPTKEQMDQIMEQFPNSWFNGTVTANTKGVL